MIIVIQIPKSMKFNRKRIMISPENIHRILIAVEDSPYLELAVNYGVLLARNLGSKIILVHADEIPIASSYSADSLLN